MSVSRAPALCVLLVVVVCVVGEYISIHNSYENESLRIKQCRTAVSSGNLQECQRRLWARHRSWIDRTRPPMHAVAAPQDAAVSRAGLTDGCSGCLGQRNGICWEEVTDWAVIPPTELCPSSSRITLGPSGRDSCPSCDDWCLLGCRPSAG